MSENVVKENKMGVMPENKLLLNMSIPMVVSMLIQALYNIVDSIFVAQINESALTAVSLAFPAQSLMIAVGAGTGTGVNAMLSRNLGAKKYEEANKTANMGILLGIISYVVFATLGLFIERPFYEFQSNDSLIVNYGVEYLTIVMIASFGVMGQLTLERLLQATGRTIYSMFMQGTGAIINLILDPILIFGYFGMPKMGVSGAAIATVVGQIAAAILGVVFNLKVNKEIKLSFKSIFKPCAKTIKNIYKVGVPAIIMQSITSVLTFAMNLILVGFTATATAVFGVYFKLNSFLFMPLFGMSNGVIPILSYNYGARKPERVLKTISLAMRYAMGLMLIGLVVFETIPDLLMHMFNASDEMLAMGVVALRIIAICFAFAGFNICCSTVFQSIGNPMHSMIMSITRQLVVLLPVAWGLSLFGDVNLVWWSFPIAEIAATVFCVIFLKKTLAKVKQLQNN